MEPGAKVKWEDGLQGLLTFGYDLVIRFDDFKRQREKRPQSKKKNMSGSAILVHSKQTVHKDRHLFEHLTFPERRNISKSTDRIGSKREKWTSAYVVPWYQPPLNNQLQKCFGLFR